MAFRPLQSPAYTKLVYNLLQDETTIRKKLKKIPSHSSEGLAIKQGKRIARSHILRMVNKLNAQTKRKIIGRLDGKGAGNYSKFYINWDKMMELTIEIGVDKCSQPNILNKSKKIRDAVSKGFHSDGERSEYSKYIEAHFRNVLLHHGHPKTGERIGYDKTLSILEIIDDFYTDLGMIKFNDFVPWHDTLPGELTPREALWAISHLYILELLDNPKCFRPGADHIPGLI